MNRVIETRPTSSDRSVAAAEPHSPPEAPSTEQSSYTGEAATVAAFGVGPSNVQTPCPVVGGSVEAAVLDALDPFWTRGIVMPGAPK